MNSKWLLYTGIVLLTLGIVLKASTDIAPWALIILLSGVAFKVIYIAYKIFKKEYRPGYEMIFLFVGLSLFLGGIILHKSALIDNPALMKISGISLKVLFILLFIKKSRVQKKLSTT